MKKYNVLWISPCPPISGLRHAGGVNFKHDYDNFVNDERFEVWIITLSNSDERKIIEKELANNKHSVVVKGVSGTSSIAKIKNIESRYNPFNRNANLISNYCADKIIEECKKLGEYIPDIIILEWTEIVVLAKALRKIFPKAILIAKEHDVTFIGYERKWKYQSGLHRLVWRQKFQHEKKVEIEALKNCDLIIPHNPENEKELIQEGISRKQISWYVPYYQNLSHFDRRPNNTNILFFGAMSRPENYLSCIWFIENVMPLISDIPVKFIVLGNNPNEELLRRQSDKIIVTGFIEDIRPYFETAMCLVAPLVLGAGIKIKVLEALSSGIPVLTNDIGIEGISATHNKEYFHCETPIEYEKTIRAIFNNEKNIQNVTKAARSLIEKYDHNKTFSDYKDRIITLVRNNGIASLQLKEGID